MTRWARRYLAALLAGAVLVALAPLAGARWSDPGPARAALAFATVPLAGAVAPATDAALPWPAGGMHPEPCDEGAAPCSGDSPTSPIPCAPAPGCMVVAYLPAAPAVVNGAPTEALVARRSSPVTPSRLTLDLPTPPPRV